jgi:predicted nucleic acid-binding protein
MAALDTNVVIRLIIGDDAKHKPTGQSNSNSIYSDPLALLIPLRRPSLRFASSVAEVH